MTKDLADLGEVRSRLEHPRRRGVAEAMRSDRPEIGTRADARRTTAETPVESSGPCGARRRTNTVGVSIPLGRPRVNQAAIASPTSVGSGNRSRRAPLPRTISSPRRHSMSASPSPATSPARSPSREHNVKIAKSRRPTDRRRSQRRRRRANSFTPMPRGRRASDQPAADGTAGASDRGVLPVAWRKREPGPRARHGGTRRPDASTGTLVPDETRHCSGIQRLEIGLASTAGVDEELSGHTDVAPDALLRQAPPPQVPLELSKEGFDRCPGSWRFFGHEADFAQVVDHRRHRAFRQQVHIALGPSSGDERTDRCTIDLCRSELAVLEPSAEVRHQVHLVNHGIPTCTRWPTGAPESPPRGSPARP